MAEWFKMLIFNSLNRSSSHPCGFEPSAGRARRQVLFVGGQVFFLEYLPFSPQMSEIFLMGHNPLLPTPPVQNWIYTWSLLMVTWLDTECFRKGQLQPHSRGYGDEGYRDSGRGDKRKMDFDDYGRESSKRGAGYGHSGSVNKDVYIAQNFSIAILH